MKKTLWPLAVLLLLGAGCAKDTAPVPSDQVLGNTVPVVLTPQSQLKTFEFTKDPAYTLALPESWSSVTSIEDFGGYVGESGPPDFDIPGKVRTFSLGKDQVPMFVVIKIDLKDKGKKAIPAEDYVLGQNATSAFYGGLITENSQEWSFLYDGRQSKYAERMKEIPHIFASFKLK